MNKHLTQLFNNGSNNGDIIIICNDEVKINCHSFVLETQTEYGKTRSRFNENKKISVNELMFDYSSKIIITAINKLYFDEFIFKDLCCNNIIELILFFDEVQVFNFDKIKQELIKLFEPQINKENWLELFEITHTNILFQELNDIILKFYIDNIINPDSLKIKEDTVRQKLIKIYDEHNQKRIFKFDYINNNLDTLIKHNTYSETDYIYFGLDDLTYINNLDKQAALDEYKRLENIIKCGNNILKNYLRHIKNKVNLLNGGNKNTLNSYKEFVLPLYYDGN